VALSLTLNFKFDFEPELRLGTARPPAARAMITMIESPQAASGRDPGRDHKTELGLGLSAPGPGCLTVLNCAMIINLKFYHDHSDDSDPDSRLPAESESRAAVPRGPQDH
jgi:hypothetical protein